MALGLTVNFEKLRQSDFQWIQTYSPFSLLHEKYCIVPCVHTYAVIGLFFLLLFCMSVLLPSPSPFIFLPSNSLCIIPYQIFDANPVTLPHQQRTVHIQWTIRLGAGQKVLDRSKSASNCVCRSPRVFQQIEADLSCLKVDIGMADGRFEFDGRW